MTVLYRLSPLPGLEVLSCRGFREFGNHIHDGYVVWLNSESAERYRVGGQSHVLEPGSVSVIEPGRVHANSSCSTQRRHLRSFYIDEEFLLWLRDCLAPGSDSELRLQSAEIDDTLLWQRLVFLHDAIVNNDEQGACVESAVEVFSHLFLSNGDIPTLREGCCYAKKRIESVIEYLHSHLRQPVGLERISQLAGCSRFHLIRLFRKEVGMSPYAYHLQLRLEHARKKLLAGSAIADAALDSGFSDQSHLTRKFTRRFGVSPGRYLLQSRR